MDRHRRMAQTLACLVASMTIGAAVLDWFQPSRAASPTATPQLIAELRNAIETDPQADTGRVDWHRIQIQAASNAMEVANRAFHVLVLQDGTWILTDNWRHQVGLGVDGVIRIGLQAAAHSNEVSNDQWATTQQIVRSIQDLCQVAQQDTHLTDDLALPASVGSDSASG